MGRGCPGCPSPPRARALLPSPPPPPEGPPPPRDRPPPGRPLDPKAGPVRAVLGPRVQGPPGGGSPHRLPAGLLGESGGGGHVAECRRRDEGEGGAGVPEGW